MKRLILTVMVIAVITAITIVVGCGEGDEGAVTTNDLLYRETNEVHKVSKISQYL